MIHEASRAEIARRCRRLRTRQLLLDLRLIRLRLGNLSLKLALAVLKLPDHRSPVVVKLISKLPHGAPPS